MLGKVLKEAREARDLPLREIEWATKINAEYLQALEDENFDALPASAYARGFLRTYATYLELDPEPLIADFNQARGGATEIVSTRPAVMLAPRPMTLTPGMIVTGAMLVLALAFGVYIWGQVQKYNQDKARAAAQSSPPTQVAALPSPSPSPSPGASPSSSPKVYTGVEVVLRFDLGTWIQVDVDGKPSTQTGSGGKVFATGATVTFSGAQSVQVISGKASHTFVMFNGKDLGAMPANKNGGVANWTYQKDGKVS